MPSNIIPLPRPAKKTGTSARDVAREHLQAAYDSGVRGELKDAIKIALDLAVAPRKRDLSLLQYEALKPGQKLVDGHRPGFLARATRKGVRFIYRYAHPQTGKQTELGIGYLGDVTLAEARDIWSDLRAARMAGKVPTLTSDPTTGDVLSLEELCRRYIDEYASQVKRSWKDDERLLDRHILPTYGTWSADRFTTDVARSLFQSLDGTPRERDKLRACLSTMFNVAVGRTKKLTMAETWLPANFVNPITNAATAKHTADVNFPPLTEARTYYAALVRELQAAEQGKGFLRQDYADALLLQLLTAGRTREVTDLEWSEVDLDSGRWTLPAERSKNGREHVVILSRQARELLERRHEWKAPKDRFVFPSALRPQTQPLRADLVANALAKHREALGVGPKFTSHNVRHLFSTWAGENQTPVDVVNRCTAHVVQTGINRHYNAATLNGPAGELWQDWADYLNG